MSTKEDILEQIVAEYLVHKGYFVQHNVRYRPSPKHDFYNSKKDSVHSDIDVIGINPTLRGGKRVLVVNCKSYQSGFDATKFHQLLEEERRNLEEIDWEKDATGYGGSKLWKRYRELCNLKWANALVEKFKNFLVQSALPMSWLLAG